MPLAPRASIEDGDQSGGDFVPLATAGVNPPAAVSQAAGDTSSVPAVPAAAEEPILVTEPESVAPLVGATPDVGARAPEGPAARHPPSDKLIGAPTLEQPLAASPKRSSRPRVGLGEPMGSLPPTAISWDITTMSRSEQLRITRALLRNQLAGSLRSEAPLSSTLPLATSGAARAATTATVLPHREPTTGQTGAPLPLAPLENLAGPSHGVEPLDLPPVSPVMAPLVSEVSRLTEEPESLAGGNASPTDGMGVRTAIGQRHGLDLSRVPVNRSDAAAAAARNVRAKALTSPAGVVIPAEFGSLDTGPGEAILAHELTHVAQRARLGPGLPEEDTPAGQALEAEARFAEMTLATGLTMRPQTPSPAAPASRHHPLDRPLSPAEQLPLAVPPSPAPNAEQVADSVFQRLSAVTAPGSVPGAPPPVFPPVALTASAAPAMAGPAIQRAPDDAAGAAVAGASAGAVPAAPSPPASEASGGQFGSRPPDEQLANLAEWIYPLISYRIRGELRENRERSGLLTDQYRRW
jgi:Domain of unknown function (DUF4157)